MTVRTRRFRALLRSPRGFGRCPGCALPWWEVTPHLVSVSGPDTELIGQVLVAPLCELCWSELTVVSRLPYVRRVVLDGLGELTWRATLTDLFAVVAEPDVPPRGVRLLG